MWDRHDVHYDARGAGYGYGNGGPSLNPGAQPPAPRQPPYGQQYPGSHYGGRDSAYGSEHPSHHRRPFDPAHFDEDAQERRKKGKELIKLTVHPDRYERHDRHSSRRPTAPRTGPPRSHAESPTRHGDKFKRPGRGAPTPSSDPEMDDQYRPSSDRERRNYFHKPSKEYRSPERSETDDSKSSKNSESQSGSLDLAGVDLILSPSSGDRTVHLVMDIGEDLEEQLDEMARLSRLGHFSSAREFFDSHLRHHMPKNPYIVIQYADLLLRQGSYKEVVLLRSAGDAALNEMEVELQKSDELQTLRVNWELMQVLARSHTRGSLGGVPEIFTEAVELLSSTLTDDKPMSSTEIQILGQVLYLSCHPALDSKWLRHRREIIHALPFTLSQLYHDLLGQGRIWDFHDLLVFMPTMNDIEMLTDAIFESDLISSLQTLISDWSNSVHGYDSSTTLALLSILTHILLKPIGASERVCISIFAMCLPLAKSVMENDAGNLKSRPYLRVLLAKSRFAETASRQSIDLLARQLQASHGVFYLPDIAQLPVYLPEGDEVPVWTPQDQPSELKDPVILVLRSVIDLGDWETEALTRQELVRLSADPGDELDKICMLQLSKQVDLNGYAASLAAKYLVAGGRLDKEKLGAEIAVFRSTVGALDYVDASYEWILTVLQYKLEGKSGSSIKNLLDRDHAQMYMKMEEPLLQEVSRKMPVLKEWVGKLQAWIAGRKLEKKTVAWQDTHDLYAWRKRQKPHGTHSGREEAITEQNRRISQKSAPSEQRTERDSRASGGLKPSTPVADHYEDAPRPESESAPTRQMTDAKLMSTMKGILRYELDLMADHQKALEDERRQLTMEELKRSAADDAAKIAKEEAAARQALQKRMEEGNLRIEGEMKAALAEVNANIEKALKAAAYAETQKVMEAQAKLQKMAEWEKDVERRAREAEEEAERRVREAEEEAERIREELRRKEETDRVAERLREEQKRKEEAEILEQVRREAEEEVFRRVCEEEMREKAKEEEKLKREVDDKLKREEKKRKRKMEKRKREEEERKREEEEAMRREMEAEERLKRRTEELAKQMAAEFMAKAEAEGKAAELASKEQKDEGEYKEQVKQWAAEEAQRELQKKGHITLKDAVGRNIPIPFEQAASWQSMEEIIKEAFRQVDRLRPEIEAGHYDMVGPDGHIILPQVWEMILQPGWRITMHMWPPALRGATHMPRPTQKPPPPRQFPLSRPEASASQANDNIRRRTPWASYMPHRARRPRARHSPKPPAAPPPPAPGAGLESIDAEAEGQQGSNTSDATSESGIEAEPHERPDSDKSSRSSSSLSRAMTPLSRRRRHGLSRLRFGLGRPGRTSSRTSGRSGSRGGSPSASIRSQTTHSGSSVPLESVSLASVSLASFPRRSVSLSLPSSRSRSRETTR